MTKIKLLSFVMASFLFCAPIYAQETSNEAETAPAAEDANDQAAQRLKDQARIETPEDQMNAGLKKLNTMLGEMSVNLNSENRRHFFMIYNNHNMISTVEHVRSKVNEGIEACSKANPEMEDDLNTRFDAWKEAVQEKLDEAKAQRDNMIAVQDYIEPLKIRAVMNQADDLRKETSMNAETTPVTTKEACEYLLNKMDETEKTMLTLLQTTLVRLPQEMQEADDNAADAPAQGQ
ncbi:MAG: hypothetical protein ACLFR0_08185 [Alphaproteobacteria bacterium]